MSHNPTGSKAHQKVGGVRTGTHDTAGRVDPGRKTCTTYQNLVCINPPSGRYPMATNTKQLCTRLNKLQERAESLLGPRNAPGNVKF